MGLGKEERCGEREKATGKKGTLPTLKAKTVRKEAMKGYLCDVRLLRRSRFEKKNVTTGKKMQLMLVTRERERQEDDGWTKLKT